MFRNTSLRTHTHTHTHTLTKGHSCIGHQHEKACADEEVLGGSIKSYHVVSDADEEKRQEEGEGELSEVLGYEIHVCSVHAIEVFP